MDTLPIDLRLHVLSFVHSPKDARPVCKEWQNAFPVTYMSMSKSDGRHLAYSQRIRHVKTFEYTNITSILNYLFYRRALRCLSISTKHLTTLRIELKTCFYSRNIGPLSSLENLNRLELKFLGTSLPVQAIQDIPTSITRLLLAFSKEVDHKPTDFLKPLKNLKQLSRLMLLNVHPEWIERMEFPEDTLKVLHIKLHTNQSFNGIKTWYVDAWEDVFTSQVCNRLKIFCVHGKNVELSGDVWNVFSKFQSIRELRIPLFVHPDDLHEDLEPNDLDLPGLVESMPHLERLDLGYSVIREKRDFECLCPDKIKTLPRLACHTLWEPRKPFHHVHHIRIEPWTLYTLDLWVSQMRFVLDTFPNLKKITYIGYWNIDVVQVLDSMEKKVTIVRTGKEKTMSIQEWKQFIGRLVEAFHSPLSHVVLKHDL